MTNELIVEEVYVHDVYKHIAHDFSRTRHSVWPVVQLFIDSIPMSKSCLEIGCGNGKNMLPLNARDITCIGIETCLEFIDICKKQRLNVFYADCCKLPFTDGVFDYAMSIAVFHHLSTPERRESALKEMVRILRPGGKGLISLWSVENQVDKKFTPGDNLVSWNYKGEEFHRYYHIYTRDMVQQFLLCVMDNLQSYEITNHCGNWYILFTKF